MANEIQLVSDGDGLAVIGNPTDVEHFLLDQGLDRIPSRDLDLLRLGPLLGTGGAAAKVGSELAENSGRWVKLTAESASAVRQYNLMSTKTPGVSHAMIGKPGQVKQWIQIAQGPGVLLSGPLALSALSTMMQQRAIQQQMDEIIDYLQEISEKVDDVLRNQKDAVLAEMIGVELVIEDALSVRDQVGRVSEITWSKIQATSTTIASTEVYALGQLDALAKKLDKKADLGELAKATEEAAPKVREWLAVLARCLQLQDGLSVLELDRVLDTSPEELDRHHLGLTTARQRRLERITRVTAALLAQMEATIQKANSKVLLNPFDSPAAVQSSMQVETDLRDFRERLGIESGHRVSEAKRWGQAATEACDKVATTTADGVNAARRLGAKTIDRAADALRAVHVDSEGVPSKPRAFSAAEDAGSALGGLVAGAAGTLGSLFRRRQGTVTSPNELDSTTAEGRPESPKR